MLIRRNTKAFKTIEQIIAACKDRADREKLIRLYITKAGHSIEERIPIESIEGGAELFYDMTYQTVLNNLQSAGHQLQVSEDVQGLYYFHSSANKVWAETPFEFDEYIKEEFGDMTDLPFVRKKESVSKVSFPKPKTVSDPSAKKKETSPAKKSEKPARKAGPTQPDFRLRQAIHFSDLDKIIFRQPRFTRRDVLNYYYRIADNLLPWLKDQPLVIRFRRSDGRKIECRSVEDMKKSDVELPPWFNTGGKGKNKSGALLCNDVEHLLFYAETGCLQFGVSGTQPKPSKAPNFLVIGIESPDAEATKAIEVAVTMGAILDALHLPSFIKTDGISDLHIIIPLDNNSKAETVRRTAENLCKLVQLKIPRQVSLEGSDDPEYGKVKLVHSMNDPEGEITAPYSLIEGESPMISTPLSWEELKPGLKFGDFDPDTIFKRTKRSDPLTGFDRKKVNAENLLQDLNRHYGFLLS